MLKKTFSLIMVITFFVISSAFAYVGNARTYKFHYDGCRSVGQMSERNPRDICACEKK